MAAEPKAKKGSAATPPGQGEQLPQGGASQVQEAQRLADELARQYDMQGPETAAVEPEMADPEENLDVRFDPSDEMDEVLYGPSQGLRLSPSAFSARTNRPNVTRLMRYLPQLQAQARDPSAPPYIKAMYRLLSDTLYRETR